MYFGTFFLASRGSFQGLLYGCYHEGLRGTGAWIVEVIVYIYNKVSNPNE